MASLSDKRVLVTGASGFIGSHLTRRLVDEGAEVHALTPAVSSVYPARLVDLRDQITVHEGNLTDRSAMDSLAKEIRPSIIFHLAAYTHVGKSWQRVDECVQTNVQGTVNLLQAFETGLRALRLHRHERDLRRHRRAVPRGRSGQPDLAVLGQQVRRRTLLPDVPPGPRLADRPGPAVQRVRPGAEPGPDHPGDDRARAPEARDEDHERKTDTRVQLRRGPRRRVRKAATTPGIEGELFNLGCGEEVSIRDVVTTILDLMGNPIEAEIGALPDRPTEIWRMYCDSTKARETLGWEPKHTLREGLEKTIAWYRQELQADRSSTFETD